MSPRILRPLVALSLGLTLLSTPALPAWAQQDPADGESQEDTADTRAAISLRVTPAVLEVPHEAGLSHHTLRLDNTGSQPLEIVTSVTEFTVTPDGTTLFAGPDELGAASWVDIRTPSFDLDAGEARDVEVTVDVPSDAEPGERYVSIVFAVPARDTDTEGNVTVTHRLAAKLFLAVPGEQIHQLELGELSAPRLVDAGTATFELTVHNRGNIHRRFEQPNPLVATSGDTEIPFQNFTVIGDSTRIVEAVWDDPPMVCWCLVEVQTDDGQGNLLVASTRVLIFPLRMTLAILALTAGLAMILAARRRRQAIRLQQQLRAAREQGARSARPPTA